MTTLSRVFCMILDIVTYPAPSLAEKCAPVTEMTEEIRQLAADMTETMYDAPGPRALARSSGLARTHSARAFSIFMC